MSKSRRNSFKKEVATQSGYLYGRMALSDSKLMKSMDKYFAAESERWRRIKKK